MMNKEVYEFISQQNNDPIIERRTCKISQEKFAIFQSDKDFYDSIAPTFNKKKYVIPYPTLSPIERQRRRLHRRNERSLYRRNCDASGTSIISMYKPGKYVVYDNDIRWKDNWDPLDQGMDFDFSKTFTEQFDTLLQRVPKMARIQQGNNENAVYTNCCSNNKDCYLIFSTNGSEHCMYSTFIDKSAHCVDSYAVIASQHIYDSLECANCFNVFHSQQIDDSNNIRYSYDCKNSHHLFACIGLRNQNYQVLNKPVSKEEFTDIINDPAKHKEIQEQYNTLSTQVPRMYADILQSENCTGHNLLACKNSHFSYVLRDAEDCKYCDFIRFSKRSQDVSYYGATGTNELLYECEGVGHSVYHTLFSKLCRSDSKDLLYCYECFNCQHCFGCTGLKNKAYCVFNKQYTKEQYEQLVGQIIEHMQSTQEWGEFFDPSISPFAYNETVAYDHFPLTHDEAIAKDLSRYDDSTNHPTSTPNTIHGKDLPITIDDDIINKVIICTVSAKPYRITKPELKFYRQHALPLPRKHPDIRHAERLQRRQPRNLHLRKCDKTNEPIISVYTSDAPFPVYSEKAYNEAIY